MPMPMAPARDRCGIGVRARRLRPLETGQPGPERRQSERPLDVGRYRPRPVALRKRHVVQGRAPQAAPRCEKRDRLDEIGFACTVRPNEHDRSRADLDLRAVIATEIRQRQTADAGAGHDDQ